MRTKDEQKKQALFNATIKLVNEIGFASSSVSKIAKEAGVSPSTLYVFFKNKEDLLVQTYIELKHRLAQSMLQDFDDTLPIRDIIKHVWFKTFDYMSQNQQAFDYMEQFSNSPYSELVNKEVLEKEYLPIITVFQTGIEQKIIKNVDMNFLTAFIFVPLTRLANPRLCQDMVMDEQGLETGFTMAWDAIKR